MAIELKEGDIIRAIDDHYGITNREMTKGEIVKVVSGEEITINILEHKYSKYEGQLHTVRTEHFELVQ